MTASIELTQRAGTPWIVLAGDLDMQALAGRGRDLYQHTSDGDVTIDLAEVTRIDGAGMTVLLMMLRAAARVRLINVSSAVRALLDVSDSAEFLEVVAA